MTPVFAQALAEKGALDSAITGVANLFEQAFDGIAANPYWLILVAVALFFLLRAKRR